MGTGEDLFYKCNASSEEIVHSITLFQAFSFLKSGLVNMSFFFEILFLSILADSFLHLNY